MKMKVAIFSIFGAAALLASASAWSAEATAPLNAGTAAGVQKAQDKILGVETPVVLGGAAAIGVIIGVAGSGSSSSATTTTNVIND